MLHGPFAHDALVCMFAVLFDLGLALLMVEDVQGEFPAGDLSEPFGQFLYLDQFLLAAVDAVVHIQQGDIGTSLCHYVGSYGGIESARHQRDKLHVLYLPTSAPPR